MKVIEPAKSLKKQTTLLIPHIHPLKPILIVEVTGRPVRLVTTKDIVQWDSQINAHARRIVLVDSCGDIRHTVGCGHWLLARLRLLVACPVLGLEIVPLPHEILVGDRDQIGTVYNFARRGHAGYG